MIAVALVAATAEPTETGYPDAEAVTPGTIGFLFTFFLAAAVVLLARSLLRRQRRLRARAGVVRHHPIPVEREPRRGPQNRSMSTGVDLQTGESTRSEAPDASAQARAQEQPDGAAQEERGSQPS